MANTRTIPRPRPWPWTKQAKKSNNIKNQNKKIKQIKKLNQNWFQTQNANRTKKWPRQRGRLRSKTEQKTKPIQNPKNKLR